MRTLGIRFAVLSTLVFLLAGSAGADENWPQFRGPRGDGQAKVTGPLPETFSDTENVKWKTAIHGKGWSSPVVWGNQVWLTTAKPDGTELFVVCVDLASGKILHDIKLFDIEKPQFCHDFNSYASPTPILEEGRVWVTFGSPGTACLDTKTGKVLWSRPDFVCNHHRGAGSSPVIVGDLFIQAYDGFDAQFVVALDKNTGKTVWRKDRSIEYGTEDGDRKKAYSTAAVLEIGGKMQVVSPSAGGTISYDALTGDELWSVKHGGMNAAARPLFGQGHLYITTGDGGKFKLFTVRPDGKGNVTDTHIDWSFNKQGVPTRCGPLLIDDSLYMMNEAGILTVLDGKTGEQVWQKRLGGNYSSSPVLADGKMYFFSQDGACPVIVPGSEFKQVGDNKLPDGCMASPAVVGKALIVRTKTNLYRIEK
jgi:outer membrane protein assembly factor BamB